MKKIRRTNGQEEIQFNNGGRFKVVANNAAGRGYAGAETIYLDELREHKDYGAWSAITKTQLAAKNPALFALVMPEMLLLWYLMKCAIVAWQLFRVLQIPCYG
jgi:hypothetical protein